MLVGLSSAMTRISANPTCSVTLFPHLRRRANSLIVQPRLADPPATMGEITQD